MKIADCIAPASVEIDLVAPSKPRLLASLAEKAGRATGLAPAAILAALQNREKLGSTGVGAGISIPHAAVAGLTAPFGLIVRLAKPIDFDAIDGRPVDIVCLLLSPADGGGAHLAVLSRLARLLRTPAIVEKARAAASAAQLHALLDSADA